MVMQAVVEMALYGQRFVQELLEEIFLCCLAQQNTLGVRVFSGSVSPAYHLQDVSDRVVVVGVLLPVIVLGVQDDHEVGLNSQGPGQSSCSHDDLNSSTVEQALHQPLVPLGEPLVHVGHPLAQCLSERLVSNLAEEGCNIFWLSMQEPIRLCVSSCVGQQVYSCQASLLAAWYKDNNWLPRGVLQDSVISGLGHC